MTRVWPQRESGIALIAVLWVLVLLTVVASSLTFTQRAEIDLSRGLLQTAQARQLARGGLHFALYMLQLRDADQSWRSDGEPHSLRFGDRDLPVIKGTVLLICGVVIAANLLVDVIHASLDPRPRSAAT